MISINVNNPKGRMIFVSRIYSSPAGTTPTTLTLPPGTYTIETLNNGSVDFRGRVVDVPDDTEVDLDLQPVSSARVAGANNP